MIKDLKAARDQALEAAKDGHILIFGDFTPELEEIVIDSLLVAQRGRKELRLLINSFGGKTLAYNSIKGVMSTMAASGMKFIGIVLGYAKSNGFNILQLCHKRLAIPTATLMVHWGTYPVDNSEIAALLAGETWPIEHLKACVTLEVRSLSERTGIPMEKIMEYALHERDFTGEEALEAHFLDELIPNLPNEIKIPTMVVS